MTVFRLAARLGFTVGDKCVDAAASGNRRLVRQSQYGLSGASLKVLKNAIASLAPEPISEAIKQHACYERWPP